jgi:prevent-host-death family protein
MRSSVVEMESPIVNPIERFWFHLDRLRLMKRRNKSSTVGTISTHEMRFQFGRILRAVKAGRSLTLTYRNKPLARIVPIMDRPKISSSDPVFRLHELAQPIGPLTNAEIDAALYGR